MALLGCAFALALLLGPTAARASSAAVDGTTLVYTASPDEENALTISRSGDSFVIADDGADIFPSGPCAPGGTLVMPDSGQATCPAAGITALRVDVGDRDDTVDLLVSLPSVLLGGPGKDELQAGGGPDFVDGGSGSDQVRGGNGNDVVNGGADADETIVGEDGDDTVVSRDGTADDSVGCGIGTDSLIADANDDVTSDCERVDRPCAKRRPAPRVRARRRPVRVSRRGIVRLRVDCRAAGCSGKILLRSGQERIVLASGRFATKARRVSVTLRIAPRARALLLAHSRLKVAAGVTANPVRCTGRRATTTFTLRT